MDYQNYQNVPENFVFTLNEWGDKRWRLQDATTPTMLPLILEISKYNGIRG